MKIDVRVLSLLQGAIAGQPHTPPEFPCGSGRRGSEFCKSPASVFLFWTDNYKELPVDFEVMVEQA